MPDHTAGVSSHEPRLPRVRHPEWTKDAVVYQVNQRQMTPEGTFRAAEEHLPRIKELGEVEEELAEFEYQRLRNMQMELLELTYEDAWGHHLRFVAPSSPFLSIPANNALTPFRQVREELNHEALQFVKEQRIRCLLQGAWFPHTMGYREESGPITKSALAKTVPSSWRYVRLSHNRRYLHYADFHDRLATEPRLDALQDKSESSPHRSRLLSFPLSSFLLAKSPG